MRSSDIERLLPAVFQRSLEPGRPLRALLEAMEALHAPSERALGLLDEKLDPRRAPEAFLPMLCAWVNVELPVTSGPGRVRELVSCAARLSRLRGTHRGLLELLRVATGLPGFRIDEHVVDGTGRPRPFHIRVEAPQAATEHRALIEAIIEREKPAYVTSELAFGPG